jgi:Cu/Ag efflux protein CusF
MKMNRLITALLALGLTVTAVAQDKPSLFQSRSTTIQAVVEAIDHESRLVTLRRGDGSSITFTPSPEVRNLDQVKVGDVLHAEYTQSVSIQVASVEGAAPGAGEIAGIARSEEGEMPGMVAVDTQMIVATVEAIDLEQNTYKLKFPDGSVNEYVAMNPENLKMAEVGDVVVIEITETIAAIVEAVNPGE